MTKWLSLVSPAIVPLGRLKSTAMLGGLVLILTTGTQARSEVPNTGGGTQTSRWHAQDVPSGSLRVGQVMIIAKRNDLKGSGGGYDVLTAAGIKDHDIRDGSVVMTRVFCCGGPNEVATAIFAYVPGKEAIEAGDIVEIWSGKMVKKGEPLGAMPNTVTRVVEKNVTSGTRHCAWLPDNPSFWNRVIYCDWMPKAGWSQQKSFVFPLWVDPIRAEVPPVDYFH